jgi:hypothetical protein
MELLGRRSPIRLPSLRFYRSDGRIPKRDLLKREVARLLATHDHVVALTDVYTGTEPREFTTGSDARSAMRAWVGDEPRFHPHAAQHEFEAWLLPYWSQIQRLAGSKRQRPSQQPESVNHDRPPSKLLREVFRNGSKRMDFQKILHASAILRNQDLTIAAHVCPELKSFLNTILTLSGGELL